ncbi:MAG: hypothetical protein Q8K63_07140 [Acidimicrobiales bacterium]|nr:hypothetical protein [Acidimicrobiales bacterium]
MSERRERTSAEWVTFAVAALVLLTMIGLIAREAVKSDAPPRPVATIGPTKQVGERYEVSVSVKNRGDLAAEQVQVLASLEVDGETTEGDQVVDFLAGGDEEELVFYFDDDPDDGELTVDVTGFTVP